MDSALIVTSQEKAGAQFRELLAPRSFREIALAGDSGEAGRMLLEREFDLCLINAPLTDAFGTGLAERLAAAGTTQVLLVVKAPLLEQVAAKMEPCGVFVLAKPINRPLLYGALQLMAAAHYRLQGMQKSNQKLQQKLEDIRVIDRAKCALVAYRDMTEPEAHKYIEKRAMDERSTRRLIAEDVLRTFGG